MVSTFSTLAGLVLGTCVLSVVHLAMACTDTVYVGTTDDSNDGQLAISKDGGNTWSTVLPNDVWISSISAHGDNVYAGTINGLLVSHDNGASWTQKNIQTNSTCGSNVASVFVDDQKRVYAMISDYGSCGRIAVSSDNGDTWPINFVIPTFFDSYDGEDLYVDGSTIYVAGHGGLSYTDDFGASWTFKDASSGLGANDVTCVIGKGQTIYAGFYLDGAPVSMSVDDGSTWKTTNTTPPTGGLDDSAKSMYLKDDTLYVSTAGCGLSWSNNFSTWTRKTTADGLASNSTMAISGSGDNLYLGTWGGGLSISRDSGQTWIKKTTKDGLPSDEITAVFAQCV